MEWWKRFFDNTRYGDTLEHFTPERTEAEVDFVLSALQLEKGARILDLCCGVGRHSVQFAARGYRVTGLDFNEDYIRKARMLAEETGVEAEFVRADMRRIPRGKKYDAVVNLFTSFGYFERDAENFKVLGAVSRCLEPGGRFVLDLLNRDWLMRNFIEKDWTEEPDSYTLQEREFDSERGAVVCRWIWIRNGRAKEHTSSVKQYTYGELEKELKARGMKIENCYGDFTGNPLDLDNPQMIIVARKK